jgi:biopolymer transport protein ExbD
MNLRRRSKEHAEVSTESLNDIMFFLLLFFLIVAILGNPNVVKLMLPNGKKTSNVILKPISLQIDKDHNYMINNTPVRFDQIEPAIKIELAKITTASPTVMVRIDQSLSVQDLVDVLQIGDKLKVKMVLATKPSK